MGNVKAWYTYEAFGGLRRAFGQEATALRFAGEWHDGETGLYHLRARHYDPATGRFLQQDPLGHGGDVNVYAYVGNKPLARPDPGGAVAW